LRNNRRKERFLEVASDYESRRVSGLDRRPHRFFHEHLFPAYFRRIETIAKNAGMRGQFKIMVGGSTVDEKVRAYAGADAYGTDAVAAVNLSKKWAAHKSSE
jgi:hypothetical protein